MIYFGNIEAYAIVNPVATSKPSLFNLNNVTVGTQLTRLLTHSLTYSLAYLLTHSLAYLLTHLLTYVGDVSQMNGRCVKIDRTTGLLVETWRPGDEITCDTEPCLINM